jgi:hypothetical protein
MYLLACRLKIKMKLSFFAFNHKILYLTILIVYKKNLTQSDCTDCKIITIEGEGKSFFGGLSLIVVNVLKFNRNQVDMPTIYQSNRTKRPCS